MAKGQMVVAIAVDIEPVRVGECTLVPVGGQQPRRDDRIGWDGVIGQLGFDRSDPADQAK